MHCSERLVVEEKILGLSLILHEKPFAEYDRIALAAKQDGG
jgi:hypothetical protein